MRPCLKNLRLKYGSVPDKRFNPAQLRMGIRVEKEHTDSKHIAKQIAKGHLAGESPKYYTYLARMEKSMRKHK